MTSPIGSDVCVVVVMRRRNAGLPTFGPLKMLKTYSCYNSSTVVATWNWIWYFHADCTNIVVIRDVGLLEKSYCT